MRTLLQVIVVSILEIVEVIQIPVFVSTGVHGVLAESLGEQRVDGGFEFLVLVLDFLSIGSFGGISEPLADSLDSLLELVLLLWGQLGSDSLLVLELLLDLVDVTVKGVSGRDLGLNLSILGLELGGICDHL